MFIDFPFSINARGRAAETDESDHMRDLIEQLLFTAPGERVNRPDLGSGLMQMVFAPTSPEIAAAMQFAIQAALQRWLGDVIDVRGLEVTSEDSTLRVAVEYAVRRTGDVRRDTFERSTP